MANPSLYASGYRPKHLPKKYEATSITIGGDGQAADILRRKGVPADWSDPIDAVAFFDEDSGELKALAADYANGRRVEYRRLIGGSKVVFTRTPNARQTEASGNAG